MEKEQSLSIVWCFSQSISLTFRNFFAFLGAAVLAWFFSILTLSLMFPCLMTGLENMYLQAKTGEQVKATDVFIHRRKWWSLYWDSVILAWHIGWPIAAFWFAFIILSIPLSKTLNLQLPIVRVSYLAVFILLGLWSIFRESKHLHVLNLVAEYGLREVDSRHLSSLSVKSRWKDTIFVVLLAVLTPLLFWSAFMLFHKFSIAALLYSYELAPDFWYSLAPDFWYSLKLTSIILPLLTLTMGATAMAFLHDVGEKEEVLEMVNKYKEEYQRELSKEAENPCPSCNNSNVYKTQTKFGQGDWCPDCKMSLRELRGLA